MPAGSSYTAPAKSPRLAGRGALRAASVAQDRGPAHTASTTHLVCRTVEWPPTLLDRGARSGKRDRKCEKSAGGAAVRPDGAIPTRGPPRPRSLRCATPRFMAPPSNQYPCAIAVHRPHILRLLSFLAPPARANVLAARPRRASGRLPGPVRSRLSPHRPQASSPPTSPWPSRNGTTVLLHPARHTHTHNRDCND